nr:MAG TPA: Type II secretion system, protein M [Caudoviricetes sp.]
MYDKIKVLFDNPTYRYIIIGGIGVLICLCIGYIFYQPTGSNDNNTINTVERIEKQQRESIELNRSIQRSIDRSADYSREAKGRIERSTQYNQQIGERIEQSQSGLSEARNYLKRNSELIDRIERSNRERQENNQTTTDAAQPISDGRSGGNHWSGNTSMNER